MLTCSGSVSGKNSGNVKYSVSDDQQITASHEGDISSKNEKEVLLISGKRNSTSEILTYPDTKIFQIDKDLASATKKDIETRKLSAMVIKATQAEMKQTTDADRPQSEEISVQANAVFISVVPDMMQFDKEVFTVIAGQEVVVELDNPDGMQHNLVISKPGTLEIVGQAADALARDPKGAEKNYVPEIPEVLHATKLLDPGEVTTITFTAPSEPGDYPFICTFPGHWRMMNGIMKVTK
jgi:azurin